MKYQIIQGDNRDTLKTIADNSIDAIVTDPPYGIDFLGKAWDANTGALETYQECLRVLKPGGHILAFSAARTYHHLAVTLEQAGFEIRDQIMWIYSSGFPKSQDVGRSIQRSLGVKETRKQKLNTNGGIANMGDRLEHQDQSLLERKPEVDITVVTDPEAVKWEGWGTALKPAHEPIALARKPIKLSIAKNAQQWGTGALNIDATRVPFEETNIIGMKRATGSNADTFKNFSPEQRNNKDKTKDMDHGLEEVVYEPNEQGRFPSNVIGEILQADYQKYFYCPKVSRRERHVGFDDVPDPLANYAQGDVKNHPLWDPSIGTNVQRLKHKILEHNKTLGQQHQVQGAVGNNHPTVKPIELMKYLIKLITPPGGIVLDPFNGSGSTGCAAVELGHEYIGCELDPKYVEISLKRIAEWNRPNNNFDDIFE